MYDDDYDNSNRSRQRNSNFGFQHHHFSHQRAHDIFESMFREMESFHEEFMNDPFTNRGNRQRNNNNNRNQNRSNSLSHPFFGGSLMDEFFGGDPFANFGDIRDRNFSSSTRSSSSSFSSSSFSGGAGKSGKSVSTSTFIDSTGKKTTKTTTTIYNPDGTSSVETNEYIEDAPTAPRLTNADRKGNLLSFSGRR